MALSLSSAGQDFDRLKDRETGAVVFKGQFGFEDLLYEDSFSWLEKGAAKYTPDSNAVKFLKKHLPDYELVIMLGTWCEDSHLMIPQLYKTLQESVFPRYDMYGLDRAKEAKYIEHKLFRVDRVPTVIVFREHMEVGRVTEMAEKSIELDLQKIIEQDLLQR